MIPYFEGRVGPLWDQLGTRTVDEDYRPILAAMAAWGDRWLTGPEGTPLVLHHTTCGHDMQAVVVCSECDQPIDVRTVRAKAGPGHPAAALR